MDQRGEELIAIYHSHPASQAYPSPTDRSEAHYPEAIYILVSLRSSSPEVRAFRIREDAVREVVVA
jgi:proteasome lid subunit RPN8/RPN11